MIKLFRNTEVNTKEQLSLSESLEFVNSVVENVVDEENYAPIFCTLSLVSTFFNLFTDYRVEDLNELYLNIDEYNIFMDEILNDNDFNINAHTRLINAIDNQIEFKKQQLLHKSSLDNLFDEITNLVSNLNEKMNGLDFESILTLLPQLAQLGETGLNQENMIAQILSSLKQPKTPTDYKKAKMPPKKTTKKVVEKVVPLSPTPSTEV